MGVLLLVVGLFVLKFKSFEYLKPKAIQTESNLYIGGSELSVEQEQKKSIRNGSTRALENRKKSYIKSCPDPELVGTSKYYGPGNFIDQLRQSNSKYSQLIYAIVFAVKDRSIDLLMKLYDKDKSDRLVIWNLSIACVEDTNVEYCNENLLNELSKYEANNSAYWLNIAALKIKRKDENGVLEAFNNVIASPVYNDYWTETFDAYEQTFPVEAPEMLKSVSALGFVSTLPYNYLLPTRAYCREVAKSRADIAQLCIDIGEKIEINGKNYIVNRFGLLIQKDVFEKLGDELALESIKRRIKKLQSSISQFASREVENLTMYDESLANDWYQSLKINGEQAAYEHSYNEAVRLSMNPDYNPCPTNKIEL